MHTTKWQIQLFVVFVRLVDVQFFTCAKGHGNHTNGNFGIAPSSVTEYLFSATDNSVIHLINGDNEDENFGVEAKGHRLYYTM